MEAIVNKAVPGMKATLRQIDEAVTVGLACVEQGIESKQTVRENILKTIVRLVPECCGRFTLEDIPVEVLDHIYMEMHVAFPANDRRISDIFWEGDYGTDTDY
ncbi:hypothetical protein LJC32_02800 [Oscillospiraceae bacterium OttesenSCG-928-F05]|nr:hypothetical protein [Oscillospiraceae bacterium OttesenSCG-928-F05]